MADRCLKCHTGVQKELGNPRELHGMALPGGQAVTCTGACHTEHQGPDATLNLLGSAHSSADPSAYSLKGHQTTADGAPFGCVDCHQSGLERYDLETCAACHRRIAAVFTQTHVDAFGAACLGFALFYDNRWPILLAGPVLVHLAGYSFSKRFTKWSHVYLGSAIALAPGAAWLAVDPVSFGLEALLLMVIVTCWIGGFDIIYACQDIEVDRKEGLHSLPSRIGPTAALRVARILHAVVVAALIALGWVAGLGLWYAVGVALAALLLTVENALVRPHDYRHVNLAFFTINGVVSLVLAGSAIADVLLKK